LLNDIENRFHLKMDSDGAEIVYLLRSRIAKLKIEVHEMRRRFNKLEKKNPLG